MALSKIKNIRLDGVAACVPRARKTTAEYADLTPEDRVKFSKTTGIEERRVASAEQCMSDFCQTAAERLLADLKWDRSEVELLVCVTQTPDYPIPATGILLQHRLGLSKECMAFDINLGCSGYTYGLLVAASLLNSLGRKKALLLVGDTSSKITHERDRTAAPLFGDAGTATALSFDPTAPEMHFDMHSDGGGAEAIIIRGGGARAPLTAETLQPRELEGGIIRAVTNVELNGVEIFNFGLREVPATITAVLQSGECQIADVDQFVFHQANRLMNEMIRKKAKIPEDKCPYSLKRFGNTSCSSIPLTLVTECRTALLARRQRLVLSGFGVGLSWGTTLVEVQGIACPELIEF